MGESDFIATLFLRTGYYISHCEDTDHSEESEQLEKAQLLRALKRIAKVSKIPAIAAIAEKAAVSSFSPADESEEGLSADIRKAALFFKAQDAPETLPEFQKALLYAAKSVARAYREEADHHEDEFMLESFLGKIVAALNVESDPEEFKDLNISPAEDSALTMIAEALRV